MAAPTSFTVSNETDLNSAIQAVNAATQTSTVFTITLSQGFTLSSNIVAFNPAGAGNSLVVKGLSINTVITAAAPFAASSPTELHPVPKTPS